MSGIPNASLIGYVQTNFESAYLALKGSSKDAIDAVNEAAYIALLEVAKKEHSGNIDIADITYVYTGRANKKCQYSATGKVVSLDDNIRRSTDASVEGALERAAEEVSENFTAKSRIAIVYITAQDKSTTEFIAGELEHVLRRHGFVITDRSELDKIRAEQQFGATLEVDDATAAKIGHIAGAGIVITGRVDGEGNLRRLRLRALDTTTGQVVGTASERL
jgi:hypothetical protein